MLLGIDFDSNISIFSNWADWFWLDFLSKQKNLLFTISSLEDTIHAQLRICLKNIEYRIKNMLPTSNTCSRLLIFIIWCSVPYKYSTKYLYKTVHFDKTDSDWLLVSMLVHLMATETCPPGLAPSGSRDRNKWKRNTQKKSKCCIRLGVFMLWLCCVILSTKCTALRTDQSHYSPIEGKELCWCHGWP